MTGPHIHRQSEPLAVEQTLSIGRALQGDSPATAVIQHRRDHDCRYQWTANDGVDDPPLQIVDTTPQSGPGSLTVGPRDTVSLSVPAGALPTGAYLIQIAVEHNDQRHVAPTDAQRVLVMRDG